MDTSAQLNSNTIWQEASSYLNKLISRSNGTLPESAAALQTLVGVARDLHLAEGSIRNKALADTRTLFRVPSATIAAARKLISEEIVKTAQDFNLAYSNSAEKIFSHLTPPLVAEPAAPTPNFVKRAGKSIIGKHQEWLDGKTQGTRFGIAVAEMAVGGILMDVGGRMLSVSVTGLKDGKAEMHDSNGGKIITNMLIPASATERVIKGALGIGAAGLGVAGTVSGFYNIFRSM